MKFKPYLQLVRLPNLFTAAADSLAGWLIVRGSLQHPGQWLPLVAISVCLYTYGIVLNDLKDIEVDRVERPWRPLPSGRVSKEAASGIMQASLILAPILNGLSFDFSEMWRSLAVSFALAAAIGGYNTLFKRTQLAPLVMGSCRGLNLLLGLSVDPSLGGPVCWLIAGSLAVFVAGVTWISRSEVETGRRRGIALGIGVQAAGLMGLMAGSIELADRADRALHPGLGLMVLLAVAVVVGWADFRALRRPEPRSTQRAVKTGVLALVWLDVAVVAAAQGPGVAWVVAALWVPAFVLGRWLYST